MSQVDYHVASSAMCNRDPEPEHHRWDGAYGDLIQALRVFDGMDSVNEFSRPTTR